MSSTCCGSRPESCANSRKSSNSYGIKNQMLVQAERCEALKDGRRNWPMPRLYADDRLNVRRILGFVEPAQVLVKLALILARAASPAALTNLAACLRSHARFISLGFCRHSGTKRGRC